MQFSKRTLTLSLMLFCLCVAYVILRNLKDAVILTAGPAGAEVIPFLKVWGMLPASVIITALFAALSQKLERTTLFYIFASFFLSYYLLFALVLFPEREFFELQSLANFLSEKLPTGWRGFVQMCRFWPESLFYLASELWATVIVNVLFWGMCNEAMTTDESRSSFGAIKFGGTISAFVGGLVGAFLTTKTYNESFVFGKNPFEQTLFKETIAVILLTLLAFVFFYLERDFFSEKKRSIEGKVKLGLVKSLKLVASSPYLFSLAILVIGYNLVFSLSDVLWKQAVSDAYRDPNSLMAYMNTITIWVGLIAAIAALFSGSIVNKFGWQALAVLTPAAMLLTQGAFFSAFFLVGTLSPIVLFSGAVQNCLAKALKYSAFDVSKELALVPLSPDVKWNGKAAIDGVGNDIGKTGAALSLQAIFATFGTIGVAAPLVAAVIFSTLFAWLFAVRYLGQRQEGAPLHI